MPRKLVPTRLRIMGSAASSGRTAEWGATVGMSRELGPADFAAVQKVIEAISDRGPA